jgi:glutamate carboxypeptidase
MNELLAYLDSRQDAWKGMLREMVELESPSHDAAAVTRMATWVADHVSPHATVKFFPGGQYGKHLRCNFKFKGLSRSRSQREAAAGRRLLAVGHCDTVWPTGTLQKMPFREENGRLYGPGIFDMKGGVSFFLMAVEAMRELRIAPCGTVSLLLVSDEEVGSPSSRPLTEAEASSASLALVLEPALGIEGRAKTARKGTGHFQLRVTGRAAHAGIDFAAGASAITELAGQIGKIATITNLEKGLTLNPGVIRGGTATNVVAAEAEITGDIRFWRTRDGESAVRKLRSLKPADPRCRIDVDADLNRPALERNKLVRAAFKHAQRLAADLGFRLEEGSTGGASDGNLIGALGVPVLDGIGAVGDGAHAAHEHLVASSMPQRAALLAGLLSHPVPS